LGNKSLLPSRFFYYNFVVDNLFYSYTSNNRVINDEDNLIRYILSYFNSKIDRTNNYIGRLFHI